MHNIPVLPNEPEGWGELQVGNEISYHAKQVARYADIFVAFRRLGYIHEAEWQEKLLLNAMKELIAIYEAHLLAPTAASVQHVPRETLEDAA